jgi:hypothetical protein
MKVLIIAILLTGCAVSNFAPQIYYETVCEGSKKIGTNSYETYFKTKKGKVDTVHSFSHFMIKYYRQGDKYHIYIDTLHRTAKLKRL